MPDTPSQVCRAPTLPRPALPKPTRPLFRGFSPGRPRMPRREQSRSATSPHALVALRRAIIDAFLGAGYPQSPPTTCSSSMSSSARRCPHLSQCDRHPAMPTGASCGLSPRYAVDHFHRARPETELHRQSGVYVPRAGSTSAARRCSTTCAMMVRKRDDSAAIATERAGPAQGCRCGGARRRLPAHRHGPMGRGTVGQPAPLGRLCAGRAHRPCRRHDGGGGRAPDRHPSVPKQRQGAFRRLRRPRHPLRQAADLWRPRPRSPAPCPTTGLPTPSTSPPLMAAAMAPLFAGDTVFA